MGCVSAREEGPWSAILGCGTMQVNVLGATVEIKVTHYQKGPDLARGEFGE